MNNENFMSVKYFNLLHIKMKNIQTAKLLHET